MLHCSSHSWLCGHIFQGPFCPRGPGHLCALATSGNSVDPWATWVLDGLSCHSLGAQRGSTGWEGLRAPVGG